MNIYEVEKIIKKAGKEQKTLKMVYARSSKPGEREVEPYEIRESDFFGFDIEKKNIRRFKLDQIEEINETQNAFEPKWEIKLQ